MVPSDDVGRCNVEGSSDSMCLSILLRSSTGSMSGDIILVVVASTKSIVHMATWPHISEGVSKIGCYGVHVDVHLLVSNVLCQNLCNIE